MIEGLGKKQLLDTNNLVSCQVEGRRMQYLQCGNLCRNIRKNRKDCNWQILFNFWKCKCLHTGPGNTEMNYKMGGTILSKTVKEKDLRVTMNADMKVSEQCRFAASKGNQVLGMIRRNITYKENSLIVALYTEIVRPH